MPTIVSTGLVFLFWCFLSIGAVKFIIRAIVPRRIRKSFSRLWNFVLNLACGQIESYSKIVYDDYSKKLKERKESKEQSEEEDILEGLDEESVKYNNAVAGNKAMTGNNIIYHDFKKKKRVQSK